MKKYERVIPKFNLQLFAEGDPAPAPAPVPGSPAVTPPPVSKSDLAKSIADAMGEVMGTVLAKNTEDMQKMFDEITTGMEERFKSMNGITPKTYEGIYADMSSTIDISGKRREEPGIKLARFTKIKMIAKRDDKPLATVAAEMYKHDTEFVEEYTKQLSIIGDSGGGNFVPEAYAAEIIPLLYAGTAVMELGARILPMPNGNINIPKNIGGTDAKYVGENKNKNAKNPKYRNVKLSAKKLLSKVVISNDLLRSSSYQADMFVRDDMVNQMQLRMDLAAMFGTGGDSEPLGVKNTSGVNKVTVGALPNATNTTAPIEAVETNNAKMISPGWIFNSKFKWLVYNLTDGAGNFLHREEMNRGEYHGHKFKISNQIPTGTTGKNVTDVFFGDWSEWNIGDQLSLEMDTSKDATYADEDGNMVSAWDNDQTVIKGLMIHDMAASHGGVFSVYTFNTIV